VTSPFCNTEGLAIVLAAAAFHSKQLHQHCVELRSGAVAGLAVKHGCDVNEWCLQHVHQDVFIFSSLVMLSVHTYVLLLGFVL
jgi:hypothetical protein